MGLRGPGAKPVLKTKTPAPLPLFGDAPGGDQVASTGELPLVGETRAERLICWIERLTITSGALAGQPMRLDEWQKDIIRALYETDENGLRFVRTGVISMGRKNGKTGLASALALAHLCGPEAVKRGQVLSAAADRGQASIVFDEMVAFALEQPQLAARLVVRAFNKTVEDAVTGSVYKALSADARKAHGLSPTFAIADEVAQWRDRDLFDALKTGGGAHRESLLLGISTRSPDADNPLEELLRYGASVADGTFPDRTFKSFVWSAPMDADPWVEATWRMANPALGTFRSVEDIRSQAMQAMRVPSQEAAFRAYTLNQPVTADVRFLRPDDWDACAGEAEAAGPCYCGLDLASGASDLTAFSFYWPETGKLTIKAFLPSELVDVKQSEDHAPYREWLSAGLIEAIPGRAIDRAWLLMWVAQAIEGLDVVAIGLDRWNLKDLEAVADREGISLPLSPVGMGFKDQSPAITAFETVVLQGTLQHGGNPLLRWAVSNAALDTDPAGNRKLSKQRARGRIDPLVASVVAVGLAASEPAEEELFFDVIAL
ncbi:terminase TerL endonuclease subunit [Acetobacter sp. A11-2]|uniref:terminase large subunit n=1 Tax=Acetobacter sp. A11-2 TaxID=3157859 RepID=UPI0032EEBBE3